MKKPNGIILYRGKSLVDSQRILVIATGISRKSENAKTGKEVIQTWILRESANPIEAYQKGLDSSICGNCKHASVASGGWGTCYVSVHQAPYNVWLAYKNGSYEDLNAYNMRYFKNKTIRIGSYGDPAVVPIHVWDTIHALAKNTLGYTHQWKRAYCDKRLSDYCMASVDSLAELTQARKKGWRTFRIRFDDSMASNEIVCPASKEAGEKTTCQNCGLCNGNVKDGKTVTIKIHGGGWKIKRFERIMNLRKNKKSYKHLIN